MLFRSVYKFIVTQNYRGVKGDIMILKERLRALRKEKGETQVQVALSVGIAEQHYQRFEGGVNLPNLENAWKLADHFGVTIDYLVGRTDER